MARKFEGKVFVCEYCNKKHKKSQYQIRRGITRYCNRICFNNAKKKNTLQRKEKSCGKCKKILPIENFSNLRGGYCRPCHSAHSNEWRLKNKERYNKKMRELNIKHRYKITREEYDEIMSKKECAICRKVSGRFNLDHDHKTSKIRDVLCVNCNKGLGHFQDNTSLLKDAIRYLNKHA